MEEVGVKKISEYIWEIPQTGGMQVPARIFASDVLMEKIKQDRTLLQAKHVAHLKGIQKASYVMPDAHQGYGFPIGGVAAFDLQEGVVSPGGVGYDINCGVRLLRTNWTATDIEKDRLAILTELFREVPAGVGKGGITKLSKDVLLEILKNGAEWAVKEGYGTKDDLKRTEEEGKMPGADPAQVSARALARGLPQLGTLGSGNHFLEIQAVDKIFDPVAAKTFGIEKEGQVTVMIHCGSRGFGHQVASDYIRSMEDKYGFKHLPDRELVNAPIQSEMGQNYIKAMACAINFAFANRHMIMHWVRDSFQKVLGNAEGMNMVYDVCHNLAKFEKHEIDGKRKEVCIHRKGATRSFGPGREEIPAVYRKVGQPVLIPGSMGTASYLLLGTKEAEQVSFGSTAHGAGRLMSRTKALKQFRGQEVKKHLEDKNVVVMSGSMKGLAEECHLVYKDIDEVAKISDALKIGKMVARLRPLGVMKGD